MEGLVSLPVLSGQPSIAASRVSVHEPVRGGVNLIGYHGSDAGLGVAVRRISLALDAAGVAWDRVSYDRTSSRQRSVSDGVGSGRYATNLVLITPEQLPYFRHDVGPEPFADRYTVGLWFWETDVLPPSQLRSLDLVDEVWGATEYLRAVFAAATDKPVIRMPVPLVFADAERGPEVRNRLGLDERFTFLFTFDFLSVARRKNPLGLIAAYRAAVPHPGSARLILKSINGDLFRRAKEEVLAAAADRPDIELWDRYLAADERLSLVAEADCYVSLHRSEGLGLTIAEAMAAGTPVIATGYSGNLDFCTDESSLLVRSSLVKIGPDRVYPSDGRWAEPDLVHASELIRRPFSAERVGDQMARRLREIDSLRFGGVEARS